MNSIIGQTFLYSERGKREIIPVKVIKAFKRDGQDFYKTFYPLTNRYSRHVVSVFHETFKSEIRRKLGKRWGKGAKGKLKNKNVIE